MLFVYANCKYSVGTSET